MRNRSMTCTVTSGPVKKSGFTTRAVLCWGAPTLENATVEPSHGRVHGLTQKSGEEGPG